MDWMVFSHRTIGDPICICHLSVPNMNHDKGVDQVEPEGIVNSWTVGIDNDESNFLYKIISTEHNCHDKRLSFPLFHLSQHHDFIFKLDLYYFFSVPLQTS